MPSDPSEYKINKFASKLIQLQDENHIQGGCHYFSIYLAYYLSKQFGIDLQIHQGQLTLLKDQITIIGGHSWLSFQGKLIDMTAHRPHQTQADYLRGSAVILDRTVVKGDATTYYDEIWSNQYLEDQKIKGMPMIDYNKALSERKMVKNVIDAGQLDTYEEYLKGDPSGLFLSIKKYLRK